MNRPIKFRAWNEKSKTMHSAEELGKDELQLNPDGRGFFNAHSMDVRLSQYYPHLIPLQYTGRVDKNGNEIYEGDIDQFGCIIEWHEGGFVFKSKCNPNYIHLVDVNKSNIEIVGNIYENPELI